MSSAVLLMTDIKPRFEFRIFSHSLRLAEERIRAMASCEEINESKEIYLLNQANIRDHNVKIRHDQLELKRIVERHQGLERWRPAGRWTFPVARSIFYEALWPNASTKQLVAELPDRLSRSDLLGFVARPTSTLYHANVRKRRYRFRLAGCRAELDHMLINGAAIESIALESEDPRAVLELRTALRIQDFENQSYPLALSRILGLTPLPGGENYG